MDMQLMNPVALWPTVAVVVVAAVTDLRSRRIPNLLVLPFLAVGLVSSAIARGWTGLSQGFLGFLLAVVAFGVFCFVGAMGMGDLKLGAAVGAWVGPSQLLVA